MMRHSRPGFPPFGEPPRKIGDDVCYVIEVTSNGSSGASRTGMRQIGNFMSISSAILYGVVAVAMNFVNKYTMAVFPLPMVVLIPQMAITFAIIHPLLVTGYLDFPRFNLAKCKSLFWITLLYTGNTAFALYGLITLNIPMYSTLKRLTPMVVLLTKASIRRRWPDRDILLAVLLVVLGCIVAGVGDLSFHLAGYVFALLSCTAQAAYLLLVEFQGADGISTSELLYYNAITALPLLLAVVILSGDAARCLQVYAASVAAHSTTEVLAAIALSSVAGCLLNYSLFLCVIHNSALTTTIVGVLKGVVAVVAGLFWMNPAPISHVNLLGIGFNTCGGVWYTWIKYQQKRLRKASLASASAEPLSGLVHNDSARDLATALLQGGGARSLDGSMDLGRAGLIGRKLADLQGQPVHGMQAASSLGP